LTMAHSRAPVGSPRLDLLAIDGWLLTAGCARLVHCRTHECAHIDRRRADILETAVSRGGGAGRTRARLFHDEVTHHPHVFVLQLMAVDEVLAIV
jgi:hypothetical protein